MDQRKQGSSLSVLVSCPHEEIPGLTKEVFALRSFTESSAEIKRFFGVTISQRERPSSRIGTRNAAQCFASAFRILPPQGLAVRRAPLLISAEGGVDITSLEVGFSSLSIGTGVAKK